jgi:hypothetical protein
MLLPFLYLTPRPLPVLVTLAKRLTSFDVNLESSLLHQRGRSSDLRFNWRFIFPLSPGNDLQRRVRQWPLKLRHAGRPERSGSSLRANAVCGLPGGCSSRSAQTTIQGVRISVSSPLLDGYDEPETAFYPLLRQWPTFSGGSRRIDLFLHCLVNWHAPARGLPCRGAISRLNQILFTTIFQVPKKD